MGGHSGSVFRRLQCSCIAAALPIHPPTHPPSHPPPPCCPPCSGLLTIGPRFGGAIDDAARYFKQAADQGQEADAFVEGMKRRGIR